LDQTLQQASDLARRLEGRPNLLLAYILGECTTAERHESSVSSRLFVLVPEKPGPVSTWVSRRRAEVKLKDVAALLMVDQLEKAINAFTGQDAALFERFVQQVLESGVDRSPTQPRARCSPRRATIAETSALMVEMMQDGATPTPMYFCTSVGFPVVDFVASRSKGETVAQEWWNAKVGPAKPVIGSSAFTKLMKNLQLIDSDGRWIEDRKFKFKLKLVRNVRTAPRESYVFRDMHRKLDGDGVGDYSRAKEIFYECVDVECIDAMDWKDSWCKWKLDHLKEIEELITECTRASAPTA